MKPIEAHTVLSLSEHFSIQPVDDGAVILLADSGQLYTCNETTEAFLAKVDGRRRFDEILALFVAEFEVEPALAQADLARLAEGLLEEGVLTAG